MHLEDMSCPDSENSLLLTVEEVSPPTLLINTPLTGFKVKKWLTIRILIISINLVMIHLPQLYSLEHNAIHCIYLPWKMEFESSIPKPRGILMTPDATMLISATLLCFERLSSLAY